MHQRIWARLLIFSPVPKQNKDTAPEGQGWTIGAELLYVWVGGGKKKVTQVSINNVLLLKNSLRTWRVSPPAGVSRFGLKVYKMIRWGRERGKKKNETILLSLTFWDVFVYCSQFYNLNQRQTYKIPATRSIRFSLRHIRKTRCYSSQRAAWPWWRYSSLLVFTFHVISATFHQYSGEILSLKIVITAFQLF